MNCNTTLSFYNSRQVSLQFTTGITIHDGVTIHDRKECSHHRAITARPFRVVFISNDYNKEFSASVRWFFSISYTASAIASSLIVFAP